MPASTTVYTSSLPSISREKQTGQDTVTFPLILLCIAHIVLSNLLDAGTSLSQTDSIFKNYFRTKIEPLGN